MPTIESNRPTALITGAAQRIGAVCCQHLHNKGFNLIIHYRSSHNAAIKLAEQLNAQRKDSVSIVQANLLDDQTPQSLIQHCISKFGRLDLLVNNASSFYKTIVPNTTQSQWQDLIGSNLQAPYFLSLAAQHVLQESHGCIVNIIDIYAERPMSNYSVYCIAKAGLSMMTKSLAVDFGPDVRVNGVAPGAILWPESNDFKSLDQQAKIINDTPLKRCGSANNIAESVYFLYQNNFINGQIIAVDGGRSMHL